MAADKPRLDAQIVAWMAAHVPTPAPTAVQLLIADVEDLFAAVDPITYLVDIVNSRDSDAAAEFYEQAVTGEWLDGEL